MESAGGVSDIQPFLPASTFSAAKTCHVAPQQLPPLPRTEERATSGSSPTSSIWTTSMASPACSLPAGSFRDIRFHSFGEANESCSSRSGSCAPLTTSPSPFSADKVAIRRPVSCALVPTLSWPGAQGDNGGNLSSCSLRPCMVPYCFVVEASTYYGMSLITTHLAIGS